jgi:hypothetical protein
MKTIKYFHLFLILILSFVATSQFDGYALYNKQNNNNAYLIDKDGIIAHSWSCNSQCNYTVLLKDNGNIIRGAVNNGNQINGAAVGGKVQEIDPTGSVVWEYTYSSADHCSHHDITIIGDNVLLTAWEVKSAAELTQAGYDSANSEKWPTHFVEIAQNGNGGQIVWEWHIWDHLIQDHNSAKDNYGVVANHPELIDVNMIQSSGGGPGGGGPGGGNGDWFHVNGIDYNPTLDQIAFSSRHASEIYIIDHSTSTAQAATHSGGNSGMGGDILYRWGNPSNYGASGSQIIPAAVHDVRWIKDGAPNAGWLQVFNNAGSSGHSTVDAIETPINGFNYNISTGQAFTPSSYSWRHDCLDDADGQSASDRMTNGNVFVNLSEEYMYEVDASGNLVWQYNGGGPAKAFRYECAHPGIIALLGNPCGLDITTNEHFNYLIYPNPSKGTITIEGLTNDNFSISILDAFGKLIKDNITTKYIDINKLTNGIYFLRVTQNNQTTIQKLSLLK